LVYPFFGFEAYFFFVYVPFLGEIMEEDGREKLLFHLRKNLCIIVFPEILWKWKKSCIFFAMMLAGV
jgi:hypothetical protein